MPNSNTPEEFATRTAAWLQEKVGRIPSDLSAYIDMAVKEYSRHRPLEVAEDKLGDATNDVALPTTYVDGFSQIRSVEFPIDEVPAAVLADDEWQVYRKTTGPVLRLLNYKPTASQSVRITFTKYHTTGTDAGPAVPTTVPDADFASVCALAASYACQVLANTYNQQVDPRTDAAFVDGGDRQASYRTAAKELRAIFTEHMGLTAPAGGDASTSKGIGQGWVDLDTLGPGYGAPMTHPRRYT